jgi:mono/diheme cytochrome c family protein
LLSDSCSRSKETTPTPLPHLQFDALFVKTANQWGEPPQILKPFDLLGVLSKIPIKSIMNLKSAAAIFAAIGISAAVFADDVDTSKLPPPSTKPNVTYANDIKPIFDATCIKCHGEKKPKAKLRLDSFEGVRKGGEDGKVVEPGKSAKSMLVLNVAHLGDEDDFMPPPKNKMGLKQLTPEQIGLIRAWIDQGAK